MMFERGAPDDAARLEDYLRAVRDRWVIVLLAPLVFGIGVAIYLGNQVDSFTAEARIGLGPSPVGATNVNNLRAPNLERERAEVESNVIALAASELIGTDRIPASEILEGIAVSFRPDSEVLLVEFSHPDAAFAADVVNAVATAYVNTRRGAAEGWYADRVSAAQASLAEIDRVIGQLEQRQEALNLEQAQLQQLQVPTPQESERLRLVTSEIANVTSEINAERTVQRSLALDAVARANEAQTQTPAAVLLRAAAVPTSPDGFSDNLLTLGGAVFGLLIGLSAAFLAQRLDTTARGELDIATSLDTRVLGTVTSLGLSRFRLGTSLVMLSQRAGPRVASAKESYRLLAGAVEFIRRTNGSTAFVVSSAVPAEGKSTTAANLAVALSQAGVTTVLVSADLRRPTQAQFFGVSETPGLATYLGGGSDLEPKLVAGAENLYLVPAGEKPSNPGELLGSARFKALIELLEEAADVILIDTPPLLVTADANLAAQHADGVLVVVDATRTGVDELREVRATLDRTGAPIVGAVLNKTKWRWALPGRRGRYAYYGS